MGRAEIGRAAVEAQPDGEEEVLVDLGGDGGSMETPEVSGEGGRGGGVVEGGEGGECRWRGIGGALGGAVGGGVLEDGGGGGVVEGGVLGALVRPGSHVVSARRLVAGDQDVGGLARPEHDHVGGEGLQVGGIGSDHRELVVGHREEELLVQGGVDHPEEVPLASADRNYDGVLSGTVVKISGLAVDGVSIRHIGGGSGPRSLSHHRDGIAVPPLTKKNRCFTLRLREWIGSSFSRANNKSSIDSCPEP